MTEHNPNHRLVPVWAVVDMTKWAHHFGAEEPNAANVARRLQTEADAITADVLPQAPTIDDLPGYEPGDHHRYSAHDSGFMMFAVETEGYGTFHAVDANGNKIAETDRVPYGERYGAEDVADDLEAVRKAYHQLVDRIMDKEKAQVLQTATLTAASEFPVAKDDENVIPL